MKNKLSAIAICLLVVLCSVVPVFAANPVEVDRSSSLTIQYKSDGQVFSGLEIKAYRIAEAFADGTFELCGDFKDYPVNIHGITSQSEWKTVASTLSSYIAADSIQPTVKGITDENGTVKFENIKTGIYLTLSVRVVEDKKTTVFEDFLTMLPSPNEDAEHNYDVIAYPKVTFFEHKPDNIEYKVVKQWKDTGSEDKRPDSVTVDIYKNGELESTQKLSSENNWTYKWSSEDDGSKWQAVERGIPEGYSVSVSEKGTTIVITNAAEEIKDDAPQTGDIAASWQLVPIMSLSGALLLILAIWRKRTEG